MGVNKCIFIAFDMFFVVVVEAIFNLIKKKNKKRFVTYHGTPAFTGCEKKSEGTVMEESDLTGFICYSVVILHSRESCESNLKRRRRKKSSFPKWFCFDG